MSPSSVSLVNAVVSERFGRLGPLSPIYTLNIFRIKIYVVDSETLLPALGRSYKTVSFAPAVKTVAETMAGLESHKLHVFDRDDVRVGYEDGLALATLKAFHRAFGPGAGSQALQTSMLDHLKSILDEFDSDRIHKVDLYARVKHIVTQATMRAIYGPENPFKEQFIEDAFW